MPFGHDSAELVQVARAEEAFCLVHASALRHHVAGPAPQHRIGQRAEVTELAAPERPTEDVRGAFAFGSPRGVRGLGEQARGLAVHDDEGRLGGHGDRAGLERVEVDEERVAFAGTGAGERIEQPDVRARGPLGLLAGARESERVRIVAEREQDRDRERRAGGKTGADGERAGDAQRAT